MAHLALRFIIIGSVVCMLLVGVSVGVGKTAQHELREITYAQPHQKQVYLVDTWRSLRYRLNQITPDRFYDMRFVWSPDAAQVWYFTADVNGALSTTDREFPLRFILFVDAFYWSPDNRHVAIETLHRGPYFVDRGSGSLQTSVSDIYLLDTATESVAPFRADLSDIRDHRSFYDPVWSSDGSKLAYLYWHLAVDSFTTLFIASIDSDTETEYLLPQIVAQSLAWSPNGDELTFSTDQASAEYFEYECGIWTLEIETGEVRKIAPYCADQLQYTQDGKNLSFLTEQDEYYLLSLENFTAQAYYQLPPNVLFPVWRR